ncbi:hypothetical protein CYLTODRAFT_408393 [Cylindrobasidium torrendii FP15055 ss-10]|uniref:SEC7 domain-containing protein n=1 Tax=Cylindrobasidium torrendii FP15055 ss-10 TaxID=1314674 RepID=A0A0D7BNI7_9AGAR|nr:hypothetical protein CYLTODRAFT_408393 [Cylindrobasidium torrendii FP15055 ss-10]
MTSTRRHVFWKLLPVPASRVNEGAEIVRWEHRGGAVYALASGGGWAREPLQEIRISNGGTIRPGASSSYGQGLEADHSTVRGIGRRASRTDLDFEQALRAEGTVKLREGVDMNDLGGSPTPDRSLHSTPRLTSNNGAPGTPTVVPPTPTPTGKRGMSSGGGDVFQDTEVKRRSMYRSPGTASSPDLATLLRKSKEKGIRLEKRHDSPPPLPNMSASSSSPHSTPPPVPRKNGKLHRNAPDEWTMPPSPGSPSKPAKSSVRAKTSAFLGKMLGSTSTRERSKTDAGYPLQHAFAPPVPPLPTDLRPPSSPSPIADSFTTPERALTPSSFSKPLPLSPDIDQEHSMVIVDKPTESPLPSPAPSPPPVNVFRHRSAEAQSKRRSMSVSDADVKRALASIPPSTPPRRENTLSVILTDFKGELSQLETLSSPDSFDLSDPSTPARRAAYQRSHTDPSDSSGPRPNLTKHESLTGPVLGLSFGEEGADGGGLSPRSKSLSASLSASSAPSSFASRGYPIRMQSPLRGPRPMSSRGNLRATHRSTASSSEPSLIPLVDPEGGSRVYRSQHDLNGKHEALADLKSFPSRNVDSDDRSPDEKGKDFAQKCWDEDDSFLSREKIAEWLGGTGPVKKIALQYYVDNFDFSGLRLDVAFRQLFLKGETQQVDRILDEFSRRYWECNPTCVFGSANIVHAVVYSLLLLNTDLHIADLVNRMSKNQFVRNTLTAIQMQLDASEPSDVTSEGSSVRSPDASQGRRGGKRSDSITSWNSISRENVLSSPAFSMASSNVLPNPEPPSLEHQSTSDLRSSIASSSKFVYDKAWEAEMETLLKEMYNAVKSSQILQPLASRPSTSSLAPGGSMLRNRSLRGGQTDRLTTLKRGSIRGWQTLMNQGGPSPYSSNSSIDGRASPSPSFANSTSDFYGSSSSFLAPTLGFAHNLSHTIIREAKEDDNHSIRSEESASTSISISDEELALLGAPWAKEGMLCRKQYWESANKRAKDKAWLDVFVVIQKGDLSMFTFGEHGSGGGGAMGGGNWLANANSVGAIQLTHSLAHALPPPGYNRQRPHCMVLTLSHGGVYFFQAGTEELVNEWVSTCNYWAARTSREPLTGGVSNMEYGWNRVVDAPHGRSMSDGEEPQQDKEDSMSMVSGKSSHSRFANWRDAERLFINDWKPPMAPSVSSLHDEETQMEALRKHVETLKEELTKHNELLQPMQALFQPRSANGLKAQSNFEKKSQYLLTEIVKYDVYIDSLQAAMTLRLKKRGEKALEHALAGGGESTEEGGSGWRGETIKEDEECPKTPLPTDVPSHHRREVASVGEGGIDEDEEELS